MSSEDIDTEQLDGLKDDTLFTQKHITKIDLDNNSDSDGPVDSDSEREGLTEEEDNLLQDEHSDEDDSLEEEMGTIKLTIEPPEINNRIQVLKKVKKPRDMTDDDHSDDNTEDDEDQEIENDSPYREYLRPKPAMIEVGRVKEFKNKVKKKIKKKGIPKRHHRSPTSPFEIPEDLMKAFQQAKENQEAVVLNTPCPQVNMTKLVVVLVGLPARGKSYISNMISKYLNWLGVKTQTFNSGSYRRNILGPGQANDFFDPNNMKGILKRNRMALFALEDLITFLSKDGAVGIFDATNTTRERRRRILEYMLVTQKKVNIAYSNIIFIESICKDPNIIASNVRSIKVFGSDYQSYSKEAAEQDFLNRIEQYKKVYEPLDTDFDADISFVKVIDVGKQIIMNRISGYIPGKIVQLLMNTHICPRKIYLTRHGESLFNIDDRIGGDSELSGKGKQYRQALKEFAESLNEPHLIVWTSTLKRTIQTAELLPYPQIRWKALEEINAGKFDSMTYSEIKKKYPKDFANRQKDKYHYRYPRGESYDDLVHRIEPIIIEIERQQTPVLIICHQAVMRVLYSYLNDLPPDQCTTVETRHHVVFELEPNAYGVSTTQHDLESRVQELYRQHQQRRVAQRKDAKNQKKKSKL